MPERRALRLGLRRGDRRAVVARVVVVGFAEEREGRRAHARRRGEAEDAAQGGDPDERAPRGRCYTARGDGWSGGRGGVAHVEQRLQLVGAARRARLHREKTCAAGEAEVATVRRAERGCGLGEPRARGAAHFSTPDDGFFSSRATTRPEEVRRSGVLFCFTQENESSKHETHFVYGSLVSIKNFSGSDASDTGRSQRPLLPGVPSPPPAMLVARTCRPRLVAGGVLAPPGARRGLHRTRWVSSPRPSRRS